MILNLGVVITSELILDLRSLQSRSTTTQYTLCCRLTLQQGLT